MENTQSLNYAYYCIFFEFFDCRETFVLGVAKLNQHRYLKDILTSKFESKDIVLWKRGFAFVP